jgi:hypothetical protein
MRLAPILLALACSLALPQMPASGQAVPPPAPASLDAACGRDRPQQDDRQPEADYERLASSKDPCAVADNNLARGCRDSEAEAVGGRGAPRSVRS